MDCLVTGASGFLGLNLIPELMRAGWSVRAQYFTGRGNRYLDDPRLRLVQADVTRKEQVDPIVAGVHTVFHLAADTSFWSRKYRRQTEVNLLGCVNIARACVEAGVRRLVHISTVDALGYNPEGTADETWTPYNYGGTRYNYADSKRAGEARLKELAGPHLEVVVIYPGSLLGPMDFGLQYGRIFGELRDRALPGVPAGGSSFAHVTEVARAIGEAALKGRPGQGYICAGVNATYRELFDLMAAKVDAPVPRWTLPRSVLVAYGYLQEAASAFSGRHPQVNPGMARYLSAHAYYDSSKAVRELGYRVEPISKLVDDEYTWLHAHGLP